MSHIPEVINLGAMRSTDALALGEFTVIQLNAMQGMAERLRQTAMQSPRQANAARMGLKHLEMQRQLMVLLQETLKRAGVPIVTNDVQAFRVEPN